MRRLGRITAAAALIGSGVAAFAAGSPASAATPPPGPTITIDPVNGGKPITTGAPQFTVTGKATPDANWDLKTVVVSIDGWDGNSFGAPVTLTGSAPAFTAQFPNGPPAITHNGTYAVHVTATETPNAQAQGCLGQGSPVLPCPPDRSTSASTNVAMVLPPIAVKGLTVSPPSPGSRAVTLKWDANPEPDIIEYLVLRQAPDAKEASVIAAPAVTTQTDPQPPAAGGKVAYTVAAVRAGASGSTDRSSCGTNLANCVVGGQAGIQSVTVPADPAALAAATTPITLANGTPAAVPNLAANGPGPALPVPIIPGVNLNGAKSLGAGTPPTLADGTFVPVLPFLPGSANDKEEGPADAVVSHVGLPSIAGSGRSRPFLFWPAAALLALVLAMLLLWVRREVNRRPTDGLAPLPAGSDERDWRAAIAATVPVGAATAAPAAVEDEPAAWLGPQTDVWAREGDESPSDDVGGDRGASPGFDNLGEDDEDLPPVLDDLGADAGDLPPLLDDDEAAPAPRPRLLVSIGGRRPG